MLFAGGADHSIPPPHLYHLRLSSLHLILNSGKLEDLLDIVVVLVICYRPEELPSTLLDHLHNGRM